MPPIDFQEVPATAREPFSYAEIDGSKAQQSPQLKPYRGLIVGQRTSAGTVPELVPKRVTSAAQAANFFGPGSICHRMAIAWLQNDRSTETWIVAQDDPTGTTADGTFTFTGTATAAGTVYAYVGGERLQVAVAVGDDADDVAAALNTAINADTALPVTAAVISNVVTVDAKNDGTAANVIDLRVNHHEGEELPAGITVVAVDVGTATAGTGTPDVSEVFAVLGDVQYDVIALPYTDSASLTSIDDELEDRFLAERAIPGVAFTAEDASHSTLTSKYGAQNSRHISTLGVDGAPSPHFEIAAAVAARVALRASADPGAAYTGEPLRAIVPPEAEDLFTLQERNLALFDGVSTFTVDAQGVARISYLATHYQEDTAGQPDTAFLEVRTLNLLAYLRWSWLAFTSSFIGRKLKANDGTRPAPGQNIVTPNQAKAEAFALFLDWEALGLVEDPEQFKRDLLVEINTSDPNRLDFLVPPNLINAVRVTAARIEFRL